MLYLIKCGNYLKIGFTENLEQRTKTYETHNPDFEVLCTIDGDKNDEAYLHNLFKQYKYKNEWFYNNEEIIEVVKNYQRPLDLKIKLLEDKVNTLQKQVEYLQFAINPISITNQNSLSNSEIICEVNDMFSDPIIQQFINTHNTNDNTNN